MPVKKMELLERASMHVFSVECITTWKESGCAPSMTNFEFCRGRPHSMELPTLVLMYSCWYRSADSHVTPHVRTSETGAHRILGRNHLSCKRDCLIFRGRVGPNARLTASMQWMHAKIDTRLECLLTSTAFRSHQRAQARTNQEKKKKKRKTGFTLRIHRSSSTERMWRKHALRDPDNERESKEKCRKRPGYGLILTKFARCSRENSFTPRFSHSHTIHSTAGSFSIRRFAQPSGLASDAIDSQRKSDPASPTPFLAVWSRFSCCGRWRLRVQGLLPGSTGCAEFFPFSNRNKSSQSSTITFILCQSTVEVIPRNRIVFHFSFSGHFSNTESSKIQENTTSTKVRKAAGHSGSKKKATRPCDTPAESSWRPLFDDQQDAPMPWWLTSQSPFKSARIRANFPDTLQYKKIQAL